MNPETTARRRTRLYPVPNYIGDGSGRMFLYVLDIGGGFPRDAGNLCAFCHGDPCAERSGPETKIGAYFQRGAEREASYGYARYTLVNTCPLCQGRPT
jgi:hypothetical protein